MFNLVSISICTSVMRYWLEYSIFGMLINEKSAGMLQALDTENCSSHRALDAELMILCGINIDFFVTKFL